jgi:hypothetical protein
MCRVRALTTEGGRYGFAHSASLCLQIPPRRDFNSFASALLLILCIVGSRCVSASSIVQKRIKEYFCRQSLIQELRATHRMTPKPFPHSQVSLVYKTTTPCPAPQRQARMRRRLESEKKHIYLQQAPVA